MNTMINKPKLAVIGIGYVGLPLAISLSNFYQVKAYDINKSRILSLKRNYDITGEFSFRYSSKNYSKNLKYNLTNICTPCILYKRSCFENICLFNTK